MIRAAKMQLNTSNSSYLAADASDRKLVSAICGNHIEWMKSDPSGTERQTVHFGRTACIHVHGDNPELIVPFPKLKRCNEADLRELVSYAKHSEINVIAWWSERPDSRRRLGPLLLAYGFERGWQPHWMLLNSMQPHPNQPLPDSVTISIENGANWDVDDLPYYTRGELGCRQCTGDSNVRKHWHFAARYHDQVVGHAILSVAPSKNAVAGVYNVGVVPAMRHRRIGTALMQRVAEFARDMGIPSVTLNSAATPFYEKLGYRSLGYGQTWYMHKNALGQDLPEPNQVALCTALGQNNIKALKCLEAYSDSIDFDAPLANGLTPIQLTVPLRSTRAAEWLIGRGATLDVLTAWELGWKYKVPKLLLDKPELASLRRGSYMGTPMHHAAMYNDSDLATLLLAAGTDLSIKDSEYNGTPLGWAAHFQSSAVEQLILQNLDK